MTDYTPTTVTVADVYATATGLPEAPKRRAWFYRWFDTEIQAAERRGAIKELREAADSDDLIDHMLANLRVNQPIAVRETSKYLHNRANQLEGDHE